MPPESSPASKQGAFAFVTHYFEVVFQAQHTGDTQELKQLGEPTCRGCNGGVNLIEMVYARGGQIVGGDLKAVTPKTFQPLRAGETHLAKVTLTVTGSPQRVVKAGDLNGSYGGEVTSYAVILIRDNGRWLVSDVDTA